MKYIIFRTTVAGAVRELPVIFPEELIHVEVAQRLERLILEAGNGDCTPIAAGFVRTDAVFCTGQSETLNLASRGSKDKKLIESFDVSRGWQP